MQPARNRFEVDPETPKHRPGWSAWLKRLGVAGFLFFLIKGIGWLLVLYFGVDILSRC